MKVIEYIPKGVCSRKMTITLDGDKIENITIEGGCNGNLKGIGSLVKGMNVDEVIARLEGITCGNKPTSCPAQIALALKSVQNS